MQRPASTVSPLTTRARTSASLFDMPWEFRTNASGESHTRIGLKWVCSSHVKKYFSSDRKFFLSKSIFPHIKMQKPIIWQALHRRHTCTADPPTSFWTVETSGTAARTVHKLSLFKMCYLKYLITPSTSYLGKIWKKSKSLICFTNVTKDHILALFSFFSFFLL